jgi:hypothetical protein
MSVIEYIPDLCALFASQTFCNVLNKNMNERGASSCKRPLEDILFQTLPDLRKHERLIDLVPIPLTALLVFICIKEPNKLDFKLLIRSIWIICFSKMIMARSTILPSSICDGKRKVFALGGCHDCIFSGHVATTLVYLYSLYKIFPNEHLKYIFLLFAILYSLFVISTRSHYTIDVIVAWMVAYLLIDKFLNLE